MKIVRQDSEAIVFQATRGDEGRAKQILAIVGCLVLPGLAAFAIVHVAWWEQLETDSKLACGIALVAGLLPLLFAASDRFPYVGSLALHGSSRRVLCVWKTLRRSCCEEFDFDQIESVAVELVPGAARKWWWLLRLKRSGGRDMALGIQAFRDSAGKVEAEALATRVRDMLELVPMPAAAITMSAATERLEWTAKFALAAFMIGFAVLPGLDAFEIWQAPAWPKAVGVIESARVGKQWRRVAKRDVLKLGIKIVYRYSVDGGEYRGTRFNIWDNELAEEQVGFVEQHYGAGQACPVSYNPSNPAHSFLTTEEAPRRVAFEATTCLVFGLLGSIWLVHNVRQAMRGKSAADFALSEPLKPTADAA